jgi:hypothetical protein
MPALLLTFLIIFSVRAQETVDSVLDRYVQKLGGKEALEKVKSLQIEAE